MSVTSQPSQSATAADVYSAPMQMSQGEANKMSVAFNRLVTDITAQGTQGGKVVAGSALSDDINNAQALTSQLGENHYATGNSMNDSAAHFTNAAYSALTSFKQKNSMGTGNLEALSTLAQNVVKALQPNLGTVASPAAAGTTPATGGAPVSGSPTGGAPTTGGGTPATGEAGFAAVAADLKNEAQASTSASKAQFVGQAIDDLIAALGGGSAAPATTPATTPATAGPVGSPPANASAPPQTMMAGAPGTTSPAGNLAPPIGTQILSAAKLASGLVQQSSAPESVKSSLQNSLASLVGQVANLSTPAMSGAKTADTNLTALLDALKKAADLVPKSGLSEAVGNQLEDGLAHLVGDIAAGAPKPAGTAATAAPTTQQNIANLLQSLEGVMKDLAPYLANSSANNAQLDSLAQVLETIANSAQHS